MFCAKCGSFIPEGAQFCIKCGSPAPTAAATPPVSAFPTTGGWASQPPAAAAAAPSWSAASPGRPGATGRENPVMTLGAIIFVVLGAIAGIVAAGLSWEEAYEWATGIFLLSAMLFLIAGLFFFMAKRNVSIST